MICPSAELEESFRQDHQQFMTTLENRCSVTFVTTQALFFELLRSETPLTAIILIDPVLLTHGGRHMWHLVREYVHAGGTCIVMARFVTWLGETRRLQEFFETRVHLDWLSGSHLRGRMVINPAAVGRSLATLLPHRCRMDGYSIVNVHSLDGWYGDDGPRGWIVAMTRYGDGNFGYVGDVRVISTDLARIVIAMCGGG